MSDLKQPFGDYNPAPAESVPLPRLRAPRWTTALLASAATVALLVTGGLLRLGTSPPGEAPIGPLMAVLPGTALLLVALLALPRAPRLAWALLAVAAANGMLEVVGTVRSLEDVATGAALRDLTLMATLALVAAVAIAAGYADVNRWDATRGARAAVLLVLLGVAATIVAAAWALVVTARGEPLTVTEGELPPIRFATRLALITIAGAAAVGLARDLGPGLLRALDRLDADGDAASGDRLWRFLAYAADELVPGRAAAKRRLAEEERARLAADLHALVLPDLRRAAAAAAASGAPEAMQLDLRRALEDVEQLMHERQSIVLEQFGLISALEWLAERTEERSRIRVELDLGATVPDVPGAIDRAVARAAFRIALLGLDNVVRHAGATTARVYLSLDRAWLRLAITDDGGGVRGASGGGTDVGRAGGGGRGLADMRGEAAATGGELVVEQRSEAGTGARIDARWPAERARGNHATAPAAVADRSQPAAP